MWVTLEKSWLHPYVRIFNGTKVDIQPFGKSLTLRNSRRNLTTAGGLICEEDLYSRANVGKEICVTCLSLYLEGILQLLQNKYHKEELSEK